MRPARRARRRSRTGCRRVHCRRVPHVDVHSAPGHLANAYHGVITILFLIVLAVATALAALVYWPRGRRQLRQPARVGMAAAMMFAGVSHWLMPTPFIQHVPPFIPAAEAVVLATGVLEVLLGAALLTPPPWRCRAGLLLAVYLVAVFPGNLYVALADIDVQGQPGGWYAWLRLPLQAVFITWALWSTGWHASRRHTAETGTERSRARSAH
jgi:uncharacterized membrane protein